MLAAQNLTCVRDERTLFSDLSFTVNAGDIVQVEGENGAGKTSLLRILAGLSQP
jgi:heme exporter protein A